MSERLTAATRYGDLIGTVEIDGHDAPPLDELSSLTNMPAHYCPMGVELGLFNDFDSFVPFAVLAYDGELIGYLPDEMFDYVAIHGELPVRRFKGYIRYSAAHRYFKQCSIVAVDSRTVTVGDKLRVEDDESPTDHSRSITISKPR